MKKAFILFICISTLGSYAATAQNNPVIKKAIENPKAKDDAAKADARLIDNKQLTLTDSVSAPKNNAAKKKNCWFRKKVKTPKN